MSNRKYWVKRAARLEKSLQKQAAEVSENIINAYRRAIDDINNDIRSVFSAYVANGIPEDKAIELLNGAKSDKVYQELLRLYQDTTDSKVRKDILNRINAQAYGARISRLEGVKANAYIHSLGKSEITQKNYRKHFIRILCNPHIIPISIILHRGQIAVLIFLYYQCRLLIRF